METQTINPDCSLKERILASIAEAHHRDRQYMKTHFFLGSAFDHCNRLGSYLSLEARAASKMGLVQIEMPSEYHAPYFAVVGNLDNINLEQLEAAMAEIKAEDEKIAARRAIEIAEAKWNSLNEVSVGKIVRVTSGRKVAKGTTGIVKRVWNNVYDKWNQHVAIGTSDGLTHFTYRDNCQVILPIVETTK